MNEGFCCEVLPKRIYLFGENSGAGWYMCGRVLLRIDHRNVAVDLTILAVSLNIVAMSKQRHSGSDEKKKEPQAGRRIKVVALQAVY
jgi:hypothetical protein